MKVTTRKVNENKWEVVADGLVAGNIKRETRSIPVFANGQRYATGFRRAVTFDVHVGARFTSVATLKRAREVATAILELQEEVR